MHTTHTVRPRRSRAGRPPRKFTAVAIATLAALLISCIPGIVAVADAARSYWPPSSSKRHHGTKPRPAIVPRATVVASAAPTTAPATPVPSSSPTSPPTTAPTPTPTAGPVSPGGSALDLPRIPWEGGPAYYAAFPQSKAAGWTDPNFFPIGVWFESVLSQSDVDKDKAAGLNTYLELTTNSDAELLRRNGLTVMPSENLGSEGGETIGRLLVDEADMWAGAGSSAWTGKYPGQGEICNPTGAKCGFTVMDTLRKGMPADQRMRYANYGKGVYMWNTDAEAARFVNDFTDVVSTDIYWYTDPNICNEAANFRGIPANQCRLAANYGDVIDRQRELDARDGDRQPIFGFVEDGMPWTDSGRAIKPDQLKGAVMNSIINEARGIIYFNHNFEGPCISQHVLRESCGAAIRPAVTEVNKQIQQLAPALNTQSYAFEFNSKLDTMLKAYDGSFYIFSMLNRGSAPGSYTLSLPPGIQGSQVQVMFENRTISVNGSRQFTDTLAAESSYHIYKVTP
jgi:hypothetical protein